MASQTTTMKGENWKEKKKGLEDFLGYLKGLGLELVYIISTHIQLSGT